jgi:catechol 2,3-dioxygenase-like lactoylglutathione lyase family enzyme
MIFERLDTVLIRVKRLVEAKDWYETRLGFVEQYFDDRQKLVVFDTGGNTSLTLWELKEGEEVSQGGTAAVFPIFAVNDACEARETLLRKGVEAGEVVTDEGVSFFKFRDIDGNQLEACQVH